jgi:ribulose-phosphate 3-epimerase
MSRRDKRSAPPLVAPSILAADFARLESEIRSVEAGGAAMLHLDVMDGRFVPNITFGPLVIEAVRRMTRLRLETHLMVVEPEPLLRAFVEAGSDLVAVHVEPRAVADVRAALDAIRRLGAEPSLALNPETPVGAVLPYLEEVAQVLVMSVSPGFGGQTFLPAALDTVAALARVRSERGLRFTIAIDGGVNAETGPLCAAAGAGVLVAGSAVFRARDRAAAMRAIAGVSAAAPPRRPDRSRPRPARSRRPRRG